MEVSGFFCFGGVNIGFKELQERICSDFHTFITKKPTVVTPSNMEKFYALYF